MSSGYLFSLASQQNCWLSARQAAISGNVANANTPDYKALDVEPFEAALTATRLSLAVTQPGHMTDPNAGAPPLEVRQRDPWNILYSGNDVNLEQEMMMASEVNRAFSLNTSVEKTFHRLLIASSKG